MNCTTIRSRKAAFYCRIRTPWVRLSHAAYIATQDAEPVAIAIETIAPDGYNGEIRLIIGIKTDGTVLGVRTLSHQETPGLGDKIERKKSDWVDGFIGKKLQGSDDKAGM